MTFRPFASRTLALAAVVSVVALSSTLAGCKKGGAAVDAGGGHSAETADALTDKIQGYIGPCFNVFTESVHASARRYYEWVDSDTGPTGKETGVRGLLHVSDTKKCVDAITKANAMSPRHAALEAAGTEYARALAEVDKITEEAYAYYDREKYKDDKMAGGKALHPKLDAAFTAFDKASDALSAELDHAEDVVDANTLANYEKTTTKNSYPYLSKHVVILSRGALREVDKGPTHMDLAKFSTALAAQTAGADALEKFMKSKGDSSSTWTDMAMVVSASQDFAKQGREFERRLKAAVEKAAATKPKPAPVAAKGKKAPVVAPPPLPGADPSVREARSALVKAYNTLIEKSNDMVNSAKFHALLDKT